MQVRAGLSALPPSKPANPLSLDYERKVLDDIAAAAAAAATAHEVRRGPALCFPCFSTNFCMWERDRRVRVRWDRNGLLAVRCSYTVVSMPAGAATPPHACHGMGCSTELLVGWGRHCSPQRS